MAHSRPAHGPTRMPGGWYFLPREACGQGRPRRRHIGPRQMI